jgi:hypothetical protein
MYSLCITQTFAPRTIQANLPTGSRSPCLCALSRYAVHFEHVIHYELHSTLVASIRGTMTTITYKRDIK